MTYLIKNEEFVRVLRPDSGPTGRFFVRASEIDGLSPERIRVRLGLPEVPDRIQTVTVPPGTKGLTLEQALKAQGFDFPKFGSSQTANMLWREASRTFAENASGTVRAVIGENVNESSIWLTIELPALKANQKVDKIIRIDPKTRGESVIYAR